MFSYSIWKLRQNSMQTGKLVFSLFLRKYLISFSRHFNNLKWWNVEEIWRISPHTLLVRSLPLFSFSCALKSFCFADLLGWMKWNVCAFQFIDFVYVMSDCQNMCIVQTHENFIRVKMENEDVLRLEARKSECFSKLIGALENGAAMFAIHRAIFNF